MKSKNIRRAIEVKFVDGTSQFLEISKATKINSNIGMLHFDRIKDGSYRLTFDDSICKDFSQIESFNVVREN